MNTLANRAIECVRATDVRFVGSVLHVSLSDGREISLPIDGVTWLDWLAKATPAQKANWSIEPGGAAIYWHDFDDGIEICHLLAMQPLSTRRARGRRTIGRVHGLAKLQAPV